MKKKEIPFVINHIIGKKPRTTKEIWNHIDKQSKSESKNKIKQPDTEQLKQK
jgi:hypothetical protein